MSSVGSASKTSIKRMDTGAIRALAALQGPKTEEGFDALLFVNFDPSDPDPMDIESSAIVPYQIIFPNGDAIQFEATLKRAKWIDAQPNFLAKIPLQLTRTGPKEFIKASEDFATS